MAVNTPVRNILVYVGLDLVGDGLIKLPFIRALRDAYPDAQITWLAGKGKSVFAGALKGAVAGLIDEVIERTDIGVSFSEILHNPLPGRHFDLIIDTQRGALASLVLHRVAHRDLISPFANFVLSSLKPRREYRLPRNLQRQLFDLLEIATGHPVPTPTGITIAIDPATLDTAARLLPGGPCYVGFAPGAGGPAKCWPLENFIALARIQLAAGRIPVFILGPAEAGWDGKIAAEMAGAKFSLQQDEIGVRSGFAPELTVAVASRLALVVANDSGTGHMCAAGGVPMVSLFGPTSPEKFAPLAERVSIVRAQEFGGREMHLIPVDEVARAINEVLADSANAGAQPVR